jgi:hypothetical protein
VAEKTSTEPEAKTGSTGTLTQLFAGLVWLGTSLYVAYITIKYDAAGPSGALGAMAAALPGAIAAALVTGASIGHAASGRFRGAGGRLLAGLGMGLLFGLVIAAGIRLVYGDNPTIMKLAVLVGVASVLGGVLAVLPDKVLDAGLWATTWVFAAGLFLGALQNQGVTLLGGGPTADAAAQAAAATRFVYIQSILTGLLAAAHGYRWLTFGRPGIGWHFVAGALPGGFLLAAEWLTRVGGSSLTNIVTGYSATAPSLIDATPTSRLRHALIVLLVGGLLTMLSAVVFRARVDDASAFDNVDSDSDSDD